MVQESGQWPIKHLDLILEKAQSRHIPIYLVGGVVRDMLLGMAQDWRDIDLVVEGDAAELAALCQPVLGGVLTRHQDFLTAKLTFQDGPSPRNIDFVTARKESYAVPGALPSVESSGLKDDLARRDFTINAMAVDLESFLLPMHSRGLDSMPLDILSQAVQSDPANKVLDPHAGLLDLDAGLIRILHEKSFIDDPTRIFRAYRYALRFLFRLEPTTRHLSAEAIAAGCLGTVSMTRKLNEVKKIATEPNWRATIGELLLSGALDDIIPVEQTTRNQVSEFCTVAIPSSSANDGTEDRFCLLMFTIWQTIQGENKDVWLKKLGFGKKHKRLFRELADRKNLE